MISRSILATTTTPAAGKRLISTRSVLRSPLLPSSSRRSSTRTSVIGRTGIININKLRPASRSIAFIAASSLAGGLSLALYNSGSASNLTTGLKDQFRRSNLNILGNSFSSNSKATMAEDYPVHKSDEEWRVQLSPEQFRILRKKGTEMAADAVSPSILKYLQHAKQQLCCHVKYKQYPAKGVYNCAGCDAPLYKYDSKFKSGCGWPAFFEEIPGTVVRHTDSTFGMKRTEILCANCGGHLGHVFKGEGFGHPKDERHCVNSVSLKYHPDKSVESKD